MIYILFGAIVLLIAALLFFKQKPRRLSTSTTTQTTMAPLPRPSNDALAFLDSLKKYTLIDIIELSKVARDAEINDRKLAPGDPNIGTARCTTALASLCFASIEQVGLLLRNDLTATNVNQAISKGNRDNAASFFLFCSAKGFVSVPPAELDAVYNLFRNKITHNLFPYYHLGVSQNIANPFTNIVNSVHGTYSLNINFISDYLIRAMALLERLIQDPNEFALVNLINTNIVLVRNGEETKLRNQYHSNPSLHTYYNLWLPGFTF